MYDVTDHGNLDGCDRRLESLALAPAARDSMAVLFDSVVAMYDCHDRVSSDRPIAASKTGPS